MKQEKGASLGWERKAKAWVLPIILVISTSRDKNGHWNRTDFSFSFLESICVQNKLDSLFQGNLHHNVVVYKCLLEISFCTRHCTWIMEINCRTRATHDYIQFINERTGSQRDHADNMSWRTSQNLVCLYLKTPWCCSPHTPIIRGLWRQ